MAVTVKEKANREIMLEDRKDILEEAPQDLKLRGMRKTQLQ